MANSTLWIKKTAFVEHSVDTSRTTRFWTWMSTLNIRLPKCYLMEPFAEYFKARGGVYWSTQAEEFKPLGESSMDRPIAEELEIKLMNAPAHCPSAITLMLQPRRIEDATTTTDFSMMLNDFPKLQPHIEYRMLQDRIFRCCNHGLVEAAAT